ncbi:MAG TPA: hypothetical protein VNL71_13295 [Chloroflexota bacterium]|nr:hypothetical protein [Chloroflexota bacterium]
MNHSEDRPFGDALPDHLPEIWFRAHDGAIHWRCARCALRLPTTDGAGRHAPCPGSPAANASRPPARDQLGYEVRAGWIQWARHTAKPKPSWLVPYEDLSVEDQQADRRIGWTLVQWLLRTLIAWRDPEGPNGLSEGELCRRLGLDRIAWRDIRDQLGLTQLDPELRERHARPPRWEDEDHLDGEDGPWTAS